MSKRLTDAVVRRLPTPKTGNRITYDSAVAGFGARVTAAGHRAFVLNYYTTAGRERRHTIGEFPNWSTTAARQEARNLKQEVDKGGDPQADIEGERAAPTMAELCDRFESEHLQRKRPSTARDYAMILRKHIRPHFGASRKVADVDFADVDALHRKITKSGANYAANRTIAVLRKMFSLAVLWKMRTDNPAKGIEKNREHLRRRYLSGDELARLLAALADHPDKQAVNIIRILLLTGARRGEVFSMRWADLADGVWSKPPSSTKQNKHHQVPLSAPVRQLLSEIRAEQTSQKRALGKFVFPGIGNTGHRAELKRDWAQLCKAAGINGLRIHDLRHSFASQLASGGASLPLIGALLGHSNPATTARYSHLFADPQRAAVEKVAAIMTGAPAAEPVPLPTPRRRR
jgi:integrase